MDVLHRMLKWIDYNRGLAVALVVTALILVSMASCMPKTASLKDPSLKVDAKQFQQEAILLESELKAEQGVLKAKITSYNKRKEAGEADLKAQYELRQQVLEIAGGAISTAISGQPINWTDLVASGVGLAGVLGSFGLLYDNRRKDKKIEKAKEAAA